MRTARYSSTAGAIGRPTEARGNRDGARLGRQIKQMALSKHRRLDPDSIQRSIEKLEQRIAERFPQSGLRKTARQLAALAGDMKARSAEIEGTIWALRIPTYLLMASVVAVLLITLLSFPAWGSVETALGFVRALDPTLATLFFISSFIVFLYSIELRVKRKKVLGALRELRTMAHVVDVHQLTKSPAASHMRNRQTPSSPERLLTPFQLNRYLDYCSEMLAFIGKLAAVYVQDFPDHVAVAAVDEVEGLTTGLSRKIWQKIVLLRDEEVLDDGS